MVNFESSFFKVDAILNEEKFSLTKDLSSSIKSIEGNFQNNFLPLILNNFSLNLLEAPKENRRSFIDYLMFHVEHDYKTNHLKFKKALAQRNRALKKSSSSELKSWTKIFIDLSQKLTKLKLEFIDSFLKSFPTFVDTLSIPKELKVKFKSISITYDKGWKDNLLAELRESFVKDQARGFTSLGPQTSDLSVKINNQDSGNILSRGEQKLLILLIYLFFIKTYNDLRPNKTIFLLDDLPSELDEKNLDLALNLLQSADCQLFITSLENLEKYEFDFVIDL
tara:strand:+ start:10874 stop:11713 length:840 start_codon:yes stop_codon:yes gene_type:complete